MTNLGKWTDWKPFPDPRKGELLCAPIGAGCYELQHRSSGQKILYGRSVNLASRMCSLLSREYGGADSRDNDAKRDHVAKHLADVQYRTIPLTSESEAIRFEATELKARKGDYLFPT